ncbi:ribosomal protein L7/L12 [Microbacterium sp. Root553]|uniref:ribosomal protein L7/L12 n=1 Tax=Microbacterium sp. Root553 TaxID=1736556 RepID=UPI0006F442B9|nr:ribosomal protein L7/L12 [Microbacterium sp. Root553]KQZ24086.1 hypothetical protein ASD43_06775 [Microbacterium sp. Root553]
MDIILIVGGTIVLLGLGALVLGLALRAMRPKLPEAQVYTPQQTTAQPTASRFASPATATSSQMAPSHLTPTVTAEIDRLIAADKRIHAIKVFREHTGVSLKEAKDRIDHWSISTTAPHLAATSNITATASSITPTPSSVRGALPPSIAAEVDHLVASDQKIRAIKVVREQTGFGLKDAKDIVESWPQQHRS